MVKLTDQEIEAIVWLGFGSSVYGWPKFNVDLYIEEGELWTKSNNWKLRFQDEEVREKYRNVHGNDQLQRLLGFLGPWHENHQREMGED